MSYRKKDRKFADELMRLIHKNPACRDVAIWYDEYLTPGEGFNDAIAKMLDKSQLYTLLVTPNLVNEENYVQTTEYPAARKARKPIFPAEMESTDRAELERQYEELPACATTGDEDSFYSQLIDTLHGLALRENDSDPAHNYLIGLAYLEGIDVEVDRERALELITSAAEAELPEAMERLCEIYFQGIGIPIDYKKACQWARKALLTYSTLCGENDSKTLQAAYTLALIYEKLSDFKFAIEILEKRYGMQCAAFGENSVGALLTMCDLGRIYAKSGNSKRGLELCIKAFLGLSDTLDEDSVGYHLL